MADAPNPPDNRAYRAKLLNREGGVVTTMAIMATTLSEALEQVKGLATIYQVEIWDRGDMVHRLPHQPGR